MIYIWNMDEDGGFPVCKLFTEVFSPTISCLTQKFLASSASSVPGANLVGRGWSGGAGGGPPGLQYMTPYMEHMGKTYGSYIIVYRCS